MTDPQTLCGTADIKRYYDYVGRHTGTFVMDKIRDQTELLNFEQGNPFRRSKMLYDSDYKVYYLGEPHVYDIINVTAGTTTQDVLYTTNDYIKSTTKGMIHLNTGTSGTVAGLSNGDNIEISYVNSIFSKLCALRVCRELIEMTDVISGESMSNNLTAIKNKVDMYEQILRNNVGPILTSDVKNYNWNYYTNTKTVTQNHERNKALWEG